MMNNIGLPYHPLLNDVILSRIFDHLNGTEIIKCRLICAAWETFSQPYFAKRCNIVIGPKQSNNNSPSLNYANDRLETFCQHFPEPNLTPLVHSFVFNGLFAWDKWIRFFETRKEFVKELTLNRVQLVDYANAKESAPTICAIHDLISPVNITSLHILSFSDLTRFSVTLKMFVSIQSLRLSQCTIIVEEDFIDGDSRIKPKEVHLHSIFLKNKFGEVLERVVVNQLVDFQRVKNASFWGTNMELDMSDPSMCCDDLSLMYTPISSWATSAWTVDKMTLIRVKFDTKNRLKVKKLTIRDCYSVDVEAVPTTVQHLSFQGNGNIMSSTGCPVLLPFLTSLHLPIIDDLCLFVLNPLLSAISYG